MNLVQSIALPLTSALSLFAAPGDLDTSFGNGGTMTLQVGRSNTIRDSLVHPNGNIFVTGSVFVNKQNCGFAGLTQNGSFDQNFNGMGYLPLAIGQATEFKSIVLTPAGKILGGGYAVTNQTVFALAQSDIQGIPDPAFGGIGYITTEIGTGAEINAIDLQSNGKIIVGGIVVKDFPQIIVARYNQNGTIDTSFGDQGFIFTQIGFQSGLNALSIQPDDKILAVGYTGSAKDTIVVIRYHANGTLDETFGLNGISTYSTGNRCEAHAIQIQADNKILVGGYTFNPTLGYNIFLLLRFDATGQLDPTFNGSGVVTLDINYGSAIMALATDASGNILAGGYGFGPIQTTFVLTRFLPSGLLDLSFGSNGRVLTAIGAEAQINSLTIQPDNKIIAAGFSDNFAAIARYHP